MPENNFPIYFKTDLSTVKLLSKKESIVLYLDPKQPKVIHNKRNEFVVEYRTYLVNSMRELIEENEFNATYKRALLLCESVAGLKDYVETQKTVILVSASLIKIGIESIDRQKIEGPAIVVKEEINYPGKIEAVVNRYGEIRFADFIFDDQNSEFWTARRVGLSGLIQMNIETNDFIELGLGSSIPINFENNLLPLRMYEIGTEQFVGPEFNNDFNNDFKIA